LHVPITAPIWSICLAHFILLKSTILRHITACSALKVNRRFGATYRLHLQGRKISRACLSPAFTLVYCSAYYTSNIMMTAASRHEQRGLVGNNPASCLPGPEIKSWPGNRLSCLGFLMSSRTSCRQMQGQFLKLGHYRFFSHPLKQWYSTWGTRRHLRGYVKLIYIYYFKINTLINN
jgi:hypothetical protein